MLDNTAIEVATIKGHTLNWNQLLIPTLTKTVNGITITNNNDGSLTFNGTATADIYTPIGNKSSISIKTNHKYLISGWSNIPIFCNISGNGTTIYANTIQTATNESTYNEIRIKSGTTLNNVKVYPFLIDLTKVFGSGNEPTSVDDPKVQWAINYAKKHPEHDAGSLKNVNVEKIESFTANLWDEEWEKGIYDSSGVKDASENAIRSKNYIRVIPNTTYYVYCGTRYTNSLIIRMYDKDKNFIGTELKRNNILTISNNCCYITFCTFAIDNITTYNHDISIYKGSTNLGYIPYKKLGSLTLPNIDLRGVNDIQDTLEFVEQENGTYNLEHTKYIDRVDLGTPNWGYGNESKLFLASKPNNMKGVESNITVFNGLCSIYTVTSVNNARFELNPTINMVIACGYLTSANQLAVRNDNYTDPAAFKTAMSGVPLDYELSTPVKTVIATGLLFDEVSLLINKYGRISVVNRSSDNVNADTTFNVAVKEFKDNE